MNEQTLSSRWVGGFITIFLLGAAAAAASTPAASQPVRVTGSLISVVGGARTAQPFILTLDRYSSAADLQRLGGFLAAGPYALRDALWARRAGTLSVGGGLGYPVAVAFVSDTPGSRTVRLILDRPLSSFEVAHSTRSSKYPFGYLELELDHEGRGQGFMMGAAKLRLEGESLAVTSLGAQPLRLLAVRTE
jgi:hypothetical protein